MITRRLLLLATLLSAGCGLSAYEAKMAETQRRADQFDRKENVLGGVITPPEGCPVDVTLRVPRGLVTKAESVPQNGFFYRFGRSASGSSGGHGIFEMFVGASADGNAVAVRQQIQKTFPSAAPLPNKTVDAPGTESLSFDTWTEGDASEKAYIFLHQANGKVVAIAYRGKPSADTDAVIEASLKTLTVKAKAVTAGN